MEGVCANATLLVINDWSLVSKALMQRASDQPVHQRCPTNASTRLGAGGQVGRAASLLVRQGQLRPQEARAFWLADVRAELHAWRCTLRQKRGARLGWVRRV